MSAASSSLEFATGTRGGPGLGRSVRILAAATALLALTGSGAAAVGDSPVPVVSSATTGTPGPVAAAAVRQQRDGIRLPEDDGPPPAPLAPRHEEWLEREVGYIISPLEEEVFRRLSSDEERDLFIEAFWRTRDPTPGTALNEFREEHYRRIEYANRYLGRETPRRGWMTDRGRIYIQLGEPMEIQRYPDPRQFWPMELWIYQNDHSATGLPAHIYLLFFRPNQGAEYRLYQPGTDGPENLAKQITLSNARTRKIVRELQVTVGAEVAHAALNMNAAEPTNFVSPQISAGNAMVSFQIQEAPYYSVDQSYATRFLANRGNVESMVDFVTMPVEMRAYGFWDERGLPFLHYVVQIPADRVLLGQYEDDYYVSLGVSVEVSDLRDRAVESVSQDMEQHFDEERMEQVVRAPLAYFDRVDLVPGVYDVSVRLDNKVSEERAVASARVRIPRPSGSWTLSDLLVASAAVPARTPAAEVAPRAFRFEDRQYVPRVEGRLPPDGEAIVVVQVVPGDGALTEGTVTPVVQLLADDDTVARRSEGVAVPLRPAPSPTVLEVPVSLAGVPAGDYRVRLEARLPGGESRHVEAPLRVTPSGDGAVAPQVLMAGEAPPGNPAEYVARAAQHRRMDNGEVALTFLEAGLDRFPDHGELRRALARALASGDDPARAVELLEGLAEDGSASEEDLLLLSSLLRRQGRAAEAERLVRRLLSREPTAPKWNELARTLLALGRVEDAAGAFRSSLQLDPEQPEVRDELARLETS